MSFSSSLSATLPSASRPAAARLSDPRVPPMPHRDSLAKLDTGPTGKCVRATRLIAAGTPIFDWSRRRARVVPLENATEYDLQIGEDEFLTLVPSDALDNFVNHSCDPTCYVDWKAMRLVARVDVPPGGELTYNYHTGDYDLEARGLAFDCGCGNRQCIRRVRGFSHLSLSQKRALEPWLSPFLREKLDDELSEADP